MTIFLLRHAKAGRRSAWLDPDWLRPLSDLGRVQARDLLHTMRKARFEHILSSPYVRCMETVVPLAAHHSLAIEPTDALEEGASLDGVLTLMKEHADTGAVLCTHGDIIPLVLEHAAANGSNLGHDPQCEKGSIWVVDGDVTGAPRLRYIPAT